MALSRVRVFAQNKRPAGAILELSKRLLCRCGFRNDGTRPPHRRLGVGMLLFAVMIFSGCDQDAPLAPTNQTDLANEWPTASPAAVNIDGSRLAQAYAQARQIDGLKSLLVVRNAKMVAEEYFAGGKPNDLYHVRSVTKSVVSTLIGLAHAQGIMQLETKLAEILPAARFPLEGDKKNITLRHLLTMTSGFQWHENTEFSAWHNSANEIDYLLRKPLATPPGQNFNYNTAASHLLSVALTLASGKNTLAFAEEHLFAPLGITQGAWDRDKQGYYWGGHGLQLRPRDMAKFGLLFLQRGVWQGRQLVPSDWADAATKPQVSLNWSFAALGKIDYGYLWWLDHSQRNALFWAWGYGGQFVYCVPDLSLLVVTTAAWNLSAATATQQETLILNLITNQILPAVK